MTRYQYNGSVLGVDTVRDLAVVSICCGSFETLSFGNAQILQSGDEVVAIGYAIGLQGEATVTKGIVSAVRYSSSHMSEVIQTDAAINPGNSGGPILSPSGEILGINTFGYDETEGGRPVEGLSFAISATTVKEQISVLRSGASTPRPTPTPAPTQTPAPTPTPGERYDFGPTSGELRHNPTDNFIETEFADISLTDMMVEATFVNPYSASSNSWDYGFFYFDPTAMPLSSQVIVSSGSRWEVLAGETAPYQRVASGTFRDLEFGDGGRNHVRVVAIGDRGWLFINANFVSSFDLGDVTGAGEVAVVTGAYTGDEVQGAVTRFKDFKGYQLTRQYGPAEGRLNKEPGQIATQP